DLTLPDRRLGGLDSLHVGRPIHGAGPQVPGRSGPEGSFAVMLIISIITACRLISARRSSSVLPHAREPPGVHRAAELPGESPPPTRIESVRSAGEVGIVQD